METQKSNSSMTMNQQADITILPDDLWMHILRIGVKNSRLNHKDLCSISQSCRYLQRFSDDDTIWSQLLSSDFPRDDNSCSSPSLKSLYRKRSRLAQMLAGSPPNLSYIGAVKELFQDNNATYDCFLQVLKDFKAQRINLERVVAQVKELFKGHTELILGLNVFLPEAYAIAFPINYEHA